MTGAVPRPAAWPWWAQVLAVYLGTRMVSAVVFLAVARFQAENLWTPASPSYAQYTGLMWDCSWYRQIAENGYPSQLPVGADGSVQQNAWAFFPLFPALARLLMTVTGLPWHVVAPTLALVAGTGAALVVHRLVTEVVARPAWLGDRARDRLPLATVAVLGTAVAAPVLQVAYTESLALLLLAGALLCLARRQYLTAIPVVIGLGLTRAVALAFVVPVVAHAVSRLRAERRGDDEFPTGQRVAVVGLAAVAGAAGSLWPLVVGVLTGESDAYRRTQAAWRAGDEVVPLVPWATISRWLVDGWWLALLVAVLGLGVAAVFAPSMRRLGPEMQGWTGGYFAYLVGVIEPGTSLLRFLVLAFPVAATASAFALRSRLPRVALAGLLLVGVAGQVGWVWLLWRLVPPSGWPP